jgi:hypothetical protein
MTASIPEQRYLGFPDDPMVFRRLSVDAANLRSARSKGKTFDQR